MKRMTAICAVLLLILLLAGCSGRRWGGEAQTPGPTAAEETIAPVQTQEPRTSEPTARPPEPPEEAQTTLEQTPAQQAEETDAAAQQETAEALDDILSGMDGVKAAASGLDEAEESGVTIPMP